MICYSLRRRVETGSRCRCWNSTYSWRNTRRSLGSSSPSDGSSRGSVVVVSKTSNTCGTPCATPSSLPAFGSSVDICGQSICWLCCSRIRCSCCCWKSFTVGRICYSWSFWWVIRKIINTTTCYFQNVAAGRSYF